MLGIFQKIHRKIKEKSFLRRKIFKIFACGAQKWFISKGFWFKTDPNLPKSPPKGAKNFGVDVCLIREKQIKKHWSGHLQDQSYFIFRRWLNQKNALALTRITLFRMSAIFRCRSAAFWELFLLSCAHKVIKPYWYIDLATIRIAIRSDAMILYQSVLQLNTLSNQWFSIKEIRHRDFSGSSLSLQERYGVLFKKLLWFQIRRRYHDCRVIDVFRFACYLKHSVQNQ